VIERASWVAALVATLAALVGIPFAYIQLRLLRGDQKRIADDLARTPKLVLGFLPVRKDGKANIPSESLTIKPTWQRGEALSEPVFVYLICCNNGDRTARELLYNIAVQEGFEMRALAGGSGEGKIQKNPISGLDFWTLKDAFIHPYDMASFEATIAVQRGRRDVRYPIEVSHDYGSITTELVITVSY
jgi:hypothetical protein